VLLSSGAAASIGFFRGVPAVVVPLFADQPFKAARVAELGAGLALADALGDLVGAAA
jgi:UDP:flavonoid glycosyltransferase YjiC (YdhE family)